MRRNASTSNDLTAYNVCRSLRRKWSAIHLAAEVEGGAGEEGSIGLQGNGNNDVVQAPYSFSYLLASSVSGNEQLR